MVIDVFCACAEAAERLIESEAVLAHWKEPSAIEGYTVAGLAGHLARAVLTVERYLDAQEPGAESHTVDAAGYLTAVLGSVHPVDSDFHRTVRARGADTAVGGPEALASSLREARTRLAAALEPATLERRIEVLGGVVLIVEEYLKTRLVELVVHLDDLAVSVGREGADDLPSEAYDVVAAVLGQVAARRSGGLVTVRSLARRERQPEAVRAL